MPYRTPIIPLFAPFRNPFAGSDCTPVDDRSEDFFFAECKKKCIFAAYLYWNNYV